MRRSKARETLTYHILEIKNRQEISKTYFECACSSRATIGASIPRCGSSCNSPQFQVRLLWILCAPQERQRRNSSNNQLNTDSDVHLCTGRTTDRNSDVHLCTGFHHDRGKADPCSPYTSNNLKNSSERQHTHTREYLMSITPPPLLPEIPLQYCEYGCVSHCVCWVSIDPSITLWRYR